MIFPSFSRFSDHFFSRWISLQRALGSEHLLHLAFPRKPLVDSRLVLETPGTVQELFGALAVAAPGKHGKNGCRTCEK